MQIDYTYKKVIEIIKWFLASLTVGLVAGLIENKVI